MALFVKKKDSNTSINTATLGLDAISDYFGSLYQNEINPKHITPIVSWRFGGNDPLDAIDVYNGDGFYHFVTYGLSELYEKESDNKDISGYGMEFTFKLKKTSNNMDNEIDDVCKVLQDIARITFTSGELFKANEYIDFGEKIKIGKDSNISGFITVVDPLAKEIETLNGKVTFILFIGVTMDEIKDLKSGAVTVHELYNKISSITDTRRESIL